MKALVSIHAARPPHKMLLTLPSATRVDRLLTRTGRGKFAFDVPSTDELSSMLGIGDIAVLRSTEQGIGDYVGVITQIEERAGQGTLEVSGDNFASVLYGMAIDKSVAYANRSGGEIARQLLRQAQGMGRSVFVQEGVMRGTPLYSFTAPINFGTQHLGSALDSLAKRTGDEWWITHRIRPTELQHFLNWRTRRGHDRTRAVYLEEGRDFTRINYRRDSLGQVRSVVSVGGGAPIGERPAVAVAPNLGGSSAKADSTATPTGGVGIALSPLGARDEIDYRASDNDVTSLANAAQRQYQQPRTSSESIAVTIPLTRAVTFAPGDEISMRFFSLRTIDSVLAVRVNAIQPDEDTGEADLDVTI